MKLSLLSGLAFLFAFTTLGHAQSTTYNANFAFSDFSGFNTTTGGVVVVPYYLLSGTDLNGGSPLLISYQLSALSGGNTWSVGSSYSSGVTTSTDYFRVNTDWTSGDPTTVTATISTTGLPTFAGYDITAEHIYSPSTSSTGSNEYIWQLDQMGPGNIVPITSHLDTYNLSWTLDPVGGVIPAESEGFAFTNVNGVGPEFQSFVTYTAAVPEPSGLLLLGVCGALGVMRRRR